MGELGTDEGVGGGDVPTDEIFDTGEFQSLYNNLFNQKVLELATIP